MPKEIANKTKEEIHPHTKGIFGAGACYKCTHCLPAEASAKEGQNNARDGGNAGDYTVITE